MFIKNAILASLMVLGSMAFMPAIAAPSLPTNLDDCSLATLEPPATACSGYWDGANDSVNLLNDIDLFGFNDWQEAAYHDDTGIRDPYNIDFFATLQQTIGDVRMLAGIGTPSLPLVLVLKYANGFDAYDLQKPTPDTTGDGTAIFTFEISQELSHAGLYFRGSDTCCTFTLPRPVPNPGSLPLAMLGLAGAGFAYRKRFK